MCIGTKWIPQPAWTLSREAERSTGTGLQISRSELPSEHIDQPFLRQPDDCRSRMTPDYLGRPEQTHSPSLFQRVDPATAKDGRTHSI